MAGSVEHQARISKAFTSPPSTILVLQIFKRNPGFQFLDLDVENLFARGVLAKSESTLYPPFLYRVNSFQARSAAWVQTLGYKFIDFRGRISNAKRNKACFEAELGDQTISQLARSPRSFKVFILHIHIFVIRGAHMAR
jgi:hypothetical protein